MAIVSCSECKAEISSSANKCPRCGFVIRVPKRGFFGKLIKWSFIGWNILMLVWFIGGMNAASKVETASDAERAGAAVGTAIGASLIIGLWVAGTIVLGLFVLLTRPKSA